MNLYIMMRRLLILTLLVYEYGNRRASAVEATHRPRRVETATKTVTFDTTSLYPSRDDNTRDDRNSNPNDSSSLRRKLLKPSDKLEKEIEKRDDSSYVKGKMIIEPKVSHDSNVAEIDNVWKHSDSIPSPSGRRLEIPCYRTVRFKVDQTASNGIELRVRRPSDGVTMIVPRSTDAFENNPNMKQFYNYLKEYSISLPYKEKYEIAFINDEEELSWPKFVLPRMDEIPQCNDYVTADDLTIIEPAPTDQTLCDNLILNGDMESGTAHWCHMDPNSKLITVAGEGIQKSTALKNYNRVAKWHGPGQNLDMRCLHQNVDSFYEIEIYFRLEVESVPFTCDRYSNDYSNRCPYITFRKQRRVHERGEIKYETNYAYGQATTIASNNLEGFSLLHGVFKASEALLLNDRLFMYLNNIHEKFDVVMDNASVKKLDGVCGGNLIRNGDFDDYGKFWRGVGKSRIDIIEESTSNNKFMKVYTSPLEGAMQSLYINKDCFLESDRYAITGKFRIESASNGTKIECDPRIEWGCSNMLISATSSSGTKKIKYAESVAISGDIQQGWSILAGIMTVNEQQMDHHSMYARLYNTNENWIVFYDDISIVPIPKSCQKLVLNGNFEVGDSRFWWSKASHNWRRLELGIYRLGAGGSQYSLMMQHYSLEKFGQRLDSSCFNAGQEFQINAKFRLLNATNLESGLDCNPNTYNFYAPTHCPTIIIRGEFCAGNDLEYLLWNDIDHFQWNTNDFNDFQSSLVVGPDIASCKSVYIEVGQRLHEGRVLLVDDIQMSRKYTQRPTLSPTFLPTKESNSQPQSQPVSITDAPTTVNLFSCPLSGGSPIYVPSGSVILTPSRRLCALTKNVIFSNGETSSIPIAVSYDNNPWEQSAGDFAMSLFTGKGILCFPSGCQMSLPPLNRIGSFREVYVLASFDHSLSRSQEYARFLETATFGITQEQLDAFEENSSANVQNAIVTWMSEQMDTKITPLTSHREFWRKGVNGRIPTPVRQATVSHPCDQYSRWRTLSFVEGDTLSKLNVKGSGPFRLEVDGWLRTVVDSLIIEDIRYTDHVFNDPDYSYTICSMERRIGGRLFLKLDGINCVAVRPNALINLDGFESNVSHILDIPDENLQGIDQWLSGGDDFVYRLDTALFNNPAFYGTCSGLPSQPIKGDEPIFGRLSNGSWMIFDPRINLQTNTLDQPLNDGGEKASIKSNGITHCSNAPRTFLNENECKLSTGACKENSGNGQVEILLNNSTIAALNTITDHYVYAIKGLSVDYEGTKLEHPCTPGLRSRWEPKDVSNCKPTTLHKATNETLSFLLSDSTDQNPFLRDIFFPEEGTSCNSKDKIPEIEIEVNGECWTRVHPEHMSIFDMTYWVGNHPGGPYNIQKWSENNGTILVYPSSLERDPHGMTRWNNYWHKFPYIGRFGDNIHIRDLPSDFRGIDVIDYFVSTKDSDNGGMVVSCGSPGEVSNNVREGFQFDVKVDEGYTRTGHLNYSHNRNIIWIMIALGARDQLRQRVSWAMAQILVVVSEEVASQQDQSEHFLVYYDIFVRNAFGNYRDVLKEISYNPLMAQNLSYLRSRSSAYMLARYKIKTSADENFAREIMQLFTMGLIKLNMDGSPKLDENGNTILAYTNDDIESFSRAWTGFDLQSQRGNMEGHNNEVDPMRIIADWRDRFPKTDTTGGYIGDGYPLCSDFPSKSFLRKGAQYRLLGSSKLPELVEDSVHFKGTEDIKRLVLDQQSSLRSLLCNENQAGICNFKNIITLHTNYDCTGIECDVDTVRVVQVEPDLFYEFVHPPCITFSFYKDPVKLSPRNYASPLICADPKLAVASAVCCSTSNNIGNIISEYSGERTTFKTAQTRCSNASKLLRDSITAINGPTILSDGYFWTSDSCLLQVKIRRDGTLTIVHKPSSFMRRVNHVDVENENYYKVHWERGGDYPTVDNDCDGVCEVLPEGVCLCNTGVTENTVFRGMPSSKVEIIEKLSVGALDPSIFDTGTYTSTIGSSGDFIVYLKDNKFSSESIFEYQDDKGRTFFMKNIHSSVHLRAREGGNTGQSFRNTPQFMSFITSETNVRDAQYETEAVLDHYFFHDNTAPFLAKRLIQRLVMSNPAPRYIQTVAEAFKSGSYMSGGISFGTGKYGDLASTFAAIYLDRAARNVVLDKHVASGSIREPIVKVVSLMRSMNFVPSRPITAINRHKMLQHIGQMPFEFESVFSFFLPEFKPYGRIGDATLVSPEATLLDTPRVVGLLNGLTSLIKFGLSDCEGGWSLGRQCGTSDGILEFNKTFVASEGGFSFETFEGPSLKGGFDNRWVGKSFSHNNGKTTIDPSDSNNYVLYFPETSTGSNFFSPPIKNQGPDGPVAVKFRYLGLKSHAGGCIGYIDERKFPGFQTWALCDDGNTMRSDGVWTSCQFLVPAEVTSFRIALTDLNSPGGDAYFDDIQIGSGSVTTCSGVRVAKNVPSGQEGYSNAVVERLSLLLTAGRLGSQAKSIIADAFDGAGSADDGLTLAQQLIVTTSEFHTTDFVKSTDKPRDQPVIQHATGKPYKAVVYLMLSGGCDSFNMLVPYTCSNGLYESYLEVRQQVALQKDSLLPIPAKNQVCSEFGLHNKLPAIKSLYEDGDLLFFANTGVLTQPVTKDNYFRETNTQLFAHNTMQDASRKVDPYNTVSGTGVLGRMTDVLTRYGYNTGSFAIGHFSISLAGRGNKSGAPSVVDGKGISHFYLSDHLKKSMSKIHNKTSIESGIFADSWSASLMDSVVTSENLNDALRSVKTTVKFPNTEVGESFSTISKLIATRKIRGVDVDTFHVVAPRFDTHADLEHAIQNLFIEINGALDAFAHEMKSINEWNNTVLIQVSDFARTLTPNGGNGTDHGWGGNYMLMGGSVKGRQVLGEYPAVFTTDGPLTLHRGRMIPSTPWEAPFQGIAAWLGIEASDMLEVCPNLDNFNSSYLIDPERIFHKVKSPPPTPEIPRFPSNAGTSSEASFRSASLITFALSLGAALLLFLQR